MRMSKFRKESVENLQLSLDKKNKKLKEVNQVQQSQQKQPKTTNFSFAINANQKLCMKQD